jgi:phosphohistidine phosphatase
MRILLARHAKSDHPGGVADHDRPLSARGIADAASMGRHLGRTGLIPPSILSSTATRAAETARLIAEQATPPPTVEHVAGIYGAGVTDLLAVIASAGGDCMIVGHQPTLSMTVEALCGADVAMVTCAVACIDTAALRPGSGLLRWLITPRLVVAEDT